jgi:hypothetical protein
LLSITKCCIKYDKFVVTHDLLRKYVAILI